jgi:hypothetical protein
MGQGSRLLTQVRGMVRYRSGGCYPLPWYLPRYLHQQTRTFPGVGQPAS